MTNIIKNVVSKPSLVNVNGDTIHKNNSVLQSALNAVNNGSLSMTSDFLINDIQLTETGVQTAIINSILSAEEFDNKSKTPLNELIKWFNAGTVTKLQFEIATGIREAGKATTTPAEQTKRLLTAEEYLNNCIKLSTIDPLSLYSDLSHFTDKSTKAELLEFVTKLRESFVTAKQKEVYEVMVEKEGALNGLKELGFADFTRYEGANKLDTFQATIKTEEWRAAKEKLQENFTFICAIPKEKDEFDIPLAFRVTFSVKPE